MTLRLAVLDDYSRSALAAADWSRLAGRVTIDVYHDHLAEIAEIARRLADYEIVCAMRERTTFSAALLDRLPCLRHLFTSGMRNAAIDVEAARMRGIVVTGSPTLAHPAVELTFALTLALVRGIVAENRSLLDGSWQVGAGTGLRGSTLGILGLGRLGAEVARIARAFGMNVLAWSRNLTPELCDAHGVGYRPFDALLAESDIVTVHLKLGSDTRALINRAALAKMKPTARLINTARGEIVDEAALAAVLRGGHLAGAALDVFTVEPLPVDHVLRGVPNLLMTPHLGYSTEENYRLFYRHAVENIAAWLDGRVINALE